MPQAALDAPSQARRQHNRITRDRAQIADTAGRIGVPWRAEGLLAKLERNGSGIASCCDTAGSATGDDRPKCHPLLFADRIAKRILTAPSNRAERRAHEGIRRKVEARQP